MWQYDIYLGTCENNVGLETEDQGLNSSLIIQYGFALNLYFQFHLLLPSPTVPVLQPGLTCFLSLIILSCLLSLQCPFLRYSLEIFLILPDSTQMPSLPLVTCVEHFYVFNMCEALEIYYFILTTILQNRFYYPSITA